MSRTRRGGKKRGWGETRTLCGFHSVESVLARDASSIVTVLMDRSRHDSRSQRLRQRCTEVDLDLRLTDREELDRLSGGVRHQGVLAVVNAAGPAAESTLEQVLDAVQGPALLLILDQVQDPHNLGACLRTADGAGVHAVIVPRDGACPVNETVSRVAAGAVENVPLFYVSNLVRTMESLQQRGIWIFGTAEDAAMDFYQGDFSSDVAMVMGAEGKGMRRLTREHCDHLLRIPMLGDVPSLNVSVATGLLLYEAVRQRTGLQE